MQPIHVTDLHRHWRRGPDVYHAMMEGLIQPLDTPATRFGTAFHYRVLHGEAAFLAHYAVGGPVNERTGREYGAETKAAAEWLTAQNKRAHCCSDDYGAITEMAQHVRLPAPLEVEVKVEAMLAGVPVEGRIDGLYPDGIFDVKTIDDLDAFDDRYALRMGYVHQAYLYCVLAHKTIFRWIVCEKSPPYRCGVWETTGAALGVVDEEIQNWLAEYKQCSESDTWPSRYAEARRFTRMNFGG